MAESTWISVADRLPAPRADVIFVVSDRSARYHGMRLGGKYLGLVCGGPEFAVPGMSFEASHWQPMPEGPELEALHV